MAHGGAQEGKWMGNYRMDWVASTLHTTSEHDVSSITTADARTSAASRRLNWPPTPADFKWTRPFRTKDEIWVLCVCHHISTGLYNCSDASFEVVKWSGSVGGEGFSNCKVILTQSFKISLSLRVWRLSPSWRVVGCLLFWGRFAKLRKATISFVMSVRLSAWNNSPPTESLLIKYYF